MNVQSVVSKSRYAKLRRRNPSQVTRWIAANKLTAPALRPDGTINVALADEQLKDLLDPSQQLGLPAGKQILDEDGDQALGAAVEEEDAVPPPTQGAKSATVRYLEAKAQEKELEVEGKRRRMNAEAGRWVEAEVIVREFNAQLAGVFNDLEAWIPIAGQDLADEMNIDKRTATLIVRKSLHKFRADQARKLRERGTTLPELVEEPLLAAE